MRHLHYHWHEGVGHLHEHEDTHHGPAFGKLRVVEVEEAAEPVDVYDFALHKALKDSIAHEEAKRRDN